MIDRVATGETNSQVARALGIAEATVREHPEHAFHELEVSTRTGAVARAAPTAHRTPPPRCRWRYAVRVRARRAVSSSTRCEPIIAAITLLHTVSGSAAVTAAHNRSSWWSMGSVRRS